MGRGQLILNGSLLQVLADINNINVISVPLTEEFQLPVEKVRNFNCYRTKTVKSKRTETQTKWLRQQVYWPFQ